MKEVFNINEITSSDQDVMRELADVIRYNAETMINNAPENWIDVGQSGEIASLSRHKGKHYRFDFILTRKTEKNFDWQLTKLQECDVDEYLDQMNSLRKSGGYPLKKT